MKLLLLLIAITCLTQFSCKKKDCGDPAPSSLNGKWRMVLVKEIAAGSTFTKPASIQGEVEITITATTTSEGIFTGIIPTNEIGQHEYSTGGNQTIAIPALSMTKVMETNWGSQFVDNIRNASAYSFETGGRLDIRTTNKILTFQRQ